MSGTGSLRVGYDALDQMAANILGAGGAMDDKLNAMEARMDGRMAEMLLTLSDVARVVRISREQYQAAEARNASRFGVG